MNERNVIIIPATKTDKTTLHSGTPGKLRVVGYAQVIKVTGEVYRFERILERL